MPARLSARPRSLTLLLPAAALLLAACTTPPTDRAMVDPTTVERTATPRDYLACLTSICRAEVDVPAQIFTAPAERLFDAWREVLAAQPRTIIRQIDEKRLLLQAEQSSAVFGFIDEIALKVVQVDEKRSTFALYTRNLSGYFDFGANKAKTADLIVEVRRKLGGSG